MAEARESQLWGQFGQLSEWGPVSEIKRAWRYSSEVEHFWDATPSTIGKKKVGKQEKNEYRIGEKN